eukprot:gene35634-41850_t
MAFLATVMIGYIVTCVIGFSVAIGWKLGIVQSVVFVMVPGMAVDFVAHLTEAYVGAHSDKRNDRIRIMLTEVGITSMFLMVAIIQFFTMFGIFMFATILFSLLVALVFFPAVLAIIGPRVRGPAVRAPGCSARAKVCMWW